MRIIRLFVTAGLAAMLGGCLPGMITTFSNQGARPISVDMCGAQRVAIEAADRKDVRLDWCRSSAVEGRRPVAIEQDGKRYLYRPEPFAKILEMRFFPEAEDELFSGFVDKKGFPVNGAKARLYFDERARVWIAPKGLDTAPDANTPQPTGFPLEPYEVIDINPMPSAT